VLIGERWKVGSARVRLQRAESERQKDGLRYCRIDQRN
jgi:hypothetical protein